jgi:hypothetical protein
MYSIFAVNIESRAVDLNLVPLLGFAYLPQSLCTEILTLSALMVRSAGLRPRVSNHGRAFGGAWAASFETAGKIRPP